NLTEAIHNNIQQDEVSRVCALGGVHDIMSYTVLVVEDEPNIVLSLQFIMRQAGFTVRIASDGEQAIRAIEDYVPDLVLLDIMLPKQDGFSVCEMIRNNPDCSDVKIIMLSAKSRDADREKALELGADEFVTKPFSTRNLGETVRKLMKIEA
ncbi:MAG: response regulator, partial [Sneathiellales bacterium]|nr:response regulator [Sneathiellales bacterium]